MKIEIDNVRSIREARIEARGITLVTGDNMSGKTSILRSVAAALMGNPSIYGARKKNSSGVISAGSASASVMVTGDDWSAGVRWPECEPVGVSTPAASAVTMGVVSPAGSFSADQWATFIRGIAAGNGGDGQDVIDGIEASLRKSWPDRSVAIDEIMADAKFGLDAVERDAKKRATSAKRDWERATGERYGTAKADGWMAEGWKEINIEEEAKRLTKLEDSLRIASTKDITNSKSAEQLSCMTRELADKSNRLTSKLEVLRMDLRRDQREISFFPHSAPLECPCCGEKVQLRQNKLEKHEKSELEYGSERHVELTRNIEETSKKIKSLGAEKSKVTAELDATRRMLASIESDGDLSSRSADDIKSEIDAIKASMDAWRRTEDATKAAADVMFWTDVAKLASPTGVRLEKTIEAAASVQMDIDALAKKIFPGRRIRLNVSADGTDVLVDGKDYRTMVADGDPNSYALALDILFQILASRSESSGVIIIDRLDTLMRERMNGVMRALRDEEITVLAARSLPERPAEDKLARHGIGSTWWIENGKVEPVARAI